MPATLAPTIDLPALERALAQGISVRRAGRGAWDVTSGTVRGRTYRVQETPDGLRCACRAGQRGLSCKHSAATAARIALGGEGRSYVVHSGGARHDGPCGAQCGGLAAVRVVVDGVCVVDAHPHEGCAVYQAA